MDRASHPIRICEKAARALAPYVASPPPQHWLASDATLSYCWPCARLAKWFEMDRYGPPPPDQDWFARSEDNEEINEGIDGGAWYSGQSDTAQCCDMCGRLLSYDLTNHGVAYEVDAFKCESVDQRSISNPEAAYELANLLENGAWVQESGLRRELTKTARATLKAIRSIKRAKTSAKKQH